MLVVYPTQAPVLFFQNPCEQPWSPGGAMVVVVVEVEVVVVDVVDVVVLSGGGSVVAANITPDEDEGIGFYGEDDFVELFRAYGSESARRMPLRGGKNTVMPWTDFAGLSEDDLRALWKYLRTVPARPGSGDAAAAPPEG